MDITTRTQADATIIAIAGSMDATTVADFDAHWKKELDAGATVLVVEMGSLDYISSAGLRGILMLAKTAKAKGCKLGFAGMQSMVADMFKLSGFLTILATFADVDAALEGLR